MSVESFRGPGGASLYYRDDDFTDPWEKRPIVILAHGHPRNSNMWYAWVPGLARDFRVVRPDLRGLGLSKVPIEGYKNSPEVLMQDAIALMDHLRADKVVWIGEATGAMIGLHLAALAAERLHCAVAMTVTLRIRDAPLVTSLVGAASIQTMLTRGMRTWALDSTKNRPWHREAPPGFSEWYVDQVAQNDPLLAAAFYEPMPKVDALPLIERIGVPTMYLNGDRDFMASPEQLEPLTKNPLARVVTVEGPGYDVGYARPDACLVKVRQFLNEVGVLR